jgi:hypothetical protein
MRMTPWSFGSVAWIGNIPGPEDMIEPLAPHADLMPDMIETLRSDRLTMAARWSVLRRPVASGHNATGSLRTTGRSYRV